MILMVGCSSKPKLTLHQIIDVPEEYRYGRGNVFGTSDYERYLDAYERSFWSCVKNRAENIDYKYTLGDIAGCGWAPAVGGYQDGYLSAEKLINELIEHYGKEATLELLHEAVAFGI